MLHDIAFAIWFFLPAAEANAAPIPAAKLPGLRKWNTPIDGHRKWRGKPILGPHKTWRGIVVGIVMSTLILAIEWLLARQYGWAQNLTAPHNYTSASILLLGPVFAIGALGGDAVKSFFKRRRNRGAGATWFPFDQLDYIIGGALLVAPFIRLTLSEYIWVFIIWFIMHLVVSYLGYLTRLKDSPI